MNQNICNICGANYEYVDGRWKCPACGAYKEEELSNEEVTLLYHAAQKLRLNAFDEAEEAYRDITVRYPQNSNGWWGLVLAKYGIKYEQDYDGKMLPTCYAASYDSLLSDKNYQTALSLANAENRAYYEAQASKIESIRREWVEKAAKEPPVDVFLSYKDTELENGVERTDDSHEAFELYTHLKELGYHVFYSRETLKDKTGEKYEPYIFNALNTAKVMLVYGSKPEYISSTWVKNEWSRFYKRIKQGQKQPNALAVVYRGFNPASLPRPLSSVQSMDRDSMTFLRDLDAYVKRVVSASVALPHIERVEIKAKARSKTEQPKTERKAVETRQIGTVSTPALTANAEKLLAVGYAYLNGGQFAEALNAFESFLTNQPNNGRALLGKMLAVSSCKSLDDFSAHGVGSFTDFNLLSAVLQSVEKKDGEEILRAFCEGAKRAAKEKNFARAKEIFEQIASYDSLSVAEAREQIFYLAVTDLKDASDAVPYFLETALLYETDENEIGRKLFAVAKQARQDGLFDLSIEYADRGSAQESVSGELYRAFLWEKLCAEMGCRADSQLSQAIVNFQKYETLEEALSLGTSFQTYLRPLLNACVDHVKQNGKKANAKVFSIFEKLLTYIPQANDSALLHDLNTAAETCKAADLFEQAERYYAMMLDLDRENHATYWGLLQAKLHCRTDTELIRQNTPLAELQEFNNALLCAGANDKAMSRYIEVQAKQKAWAKRQVKWKKARKILSFAAVAVLLAVAAVLAGTRYYQSENRLKFKRTDGGYTAFAGRFYSPSGQLVIPETYHGVAVTAVADKAFYNRDLITSVVLPYGIETIGKNAFAECDQLTTVVFENRQYTLSNADVEPNRNQLKTIGDRAFYHCKRFSGFSIPYGVETIGAEAFAGTELAGELVLPKTVTYVGKNAFVGCGKLTSITVGDREEVPADWDAQWSGGCRATVDYKLRVVLNANGATEPMEQIEQYVSFGATYQLPVPKKAGYAFAGWYLGDDALTDDSGRAFSAWANNEGATLTARYTANENTLFFNGNGADAGEMAAQKIATDSAAQLTANAFARDGYAFLGWATTANGEVEYANGATYTMGTADSYILYAVWELTENRIVFHGANENDLQTQVLEKNGSRNLRANDFEKAGYTFAGWATAKNGTAVYANASALPFVERLNVDLWAVWTANVNRLVFNGNGATGGAMGEQEIPTDGSAALATNGYTRTGYLFAGWATEQNGAVQYANGVDYSMGTEPVNTLWAVWTAETYTITYDLGNGTATGNPATYTVESNSITLTNPTREGYKFIGWTGTGLTGSTLQVTIPAGVVGNRTYTAVWEAIARIVFRSDYGEGSMPDQAVDVDKPVLLNENQFTRSGYTFLGWATEQNGAVVYEDHAAFVKTTQEDTCLYAVWGGTEGLQYTVTDGYAAVSGYNGSDPAVYIPETYNGYLIREIGDSAFSNNEILESLVIPDTVIKIGKFGIEDCYQLHNIKFSANLLHIEKGAFEACRNLTDILIPESVISIGEGVFSGCSSLESITIPFVGARAGVTANDTYQYPFGYIFGTNHNNGGTATEQFYHGNNTSTVTNTTFYIPSSLKSVTVTGGNILLYAFYGCSGLTSITIPDNVTSIGIGAFINCSGLTSITIPNSVTSIGNIAFYGCSGLTSITIPDSVTSIGDRAFSGCSSLEEITIPFVGAKAGVTENDTYQYPLGYIFGTDSYPGGTATKQYYYGESTASTTNSTYYIPSSLKSVTVTGGNILYGAFYSCSGLTNISIPNNVTSIGNDSFYDCTGLTSILIPDSVTSIGSSAFLACAGLTSITIPDSVTSIGSSAFRECTGLTSITIPDSVTYIGEEYVFSGCTGLTSITIGNGVTNIGNYMFFNCTGLTSISIPDGVTSIGDSAFNNCTGLTNISIPDSVTSIGNYVFIGCYGLTSVTIPNSVLTVGNGAFYDCRNLDNVTILSEISSISEATFWGCRNLTSITIPNSVTNIDGNAFRECEKLLSIYFKGTEEEWKSISKGNNWNYNLNFYCTVYFPDNTSIRAF